MVSSSLLADPDDAALARQVIAGDPRAAALLFDRYAPLVRRLVQRLVGPGPDVADLVQDTFIGLYRTLKGLRDPSLLRSYVVGTALRVARSERRRRWSRRWVSLSFAPNGGVSEASGPASTPDHEARRAVRRLYEVLAAMDDRSQEAFVLRHVEGCELAEIAGALGCSLSTAKRVLARVEDRVAAIARRDALLAGYAGGGGAEGGRGERVPGSAPPVPLQPDSRFCAS